MLAVVALKTVTLALGALVTYFALAAYRRTGLAPLRSLAIGFALVTLGTLGAGVADALLGWPLSQVVVVESVVSAAGLLVITYSLYER